MLPMSSPDVHPGGTETQQMRVDSGKRPVRLRLRISFTLRGQQIQEQVDFSKFPAELTTGGAL
jgi:AP-1 complex subunit gamma-1